MEFLQIVAPLYYPFYQNLPHHTKTGENSHLVTSADEAVGALDDNIYDTDTEN